VTKQLAAVVVRAVLVLCALVGAGAASPAQAVTPYPVMFGLAEPSYDDYTRAESALGVKSTMRSYFMKWGHTYGDGTRFPTYELTNFYRAKGAIPVIAFGPDASHPLKGIVAGTSDAYLKSVAASAKAYGRTIMIRLMPEMNGTWEPWSIGVNGNTAAEYVAAFRRIVTLFRAAGATNVFWNWNPTATYNGKYDIAQFWPGATYVNWLGLDIYSRDTKTFAFYMDSSAKRIREVAGWKPLMVNEVGKHSGSTKPQWIKDMYAGLQRYHVRAVVYFDYDMRTRESCLCNWRLNDTSASLSAAKYAVTRSYIRSHGTGTGKYTFAQAEYYVVHGHP
jgi:hypothetical protein